MYFIVHLQFYMFKIERGLKQQAAKEKCFGLYYLYQEKSSFLPKVLKLLDVEFNYQISFTLSSH